MHILRAQKFTFLPKQQNNNDLPLFSTLLIFFFVREYLIISSEQMKNIGTTELACTRDTDFMAIFRRSTEICSNMCNCSTAYDARTSYNVHTTTTMTTTTTAATKNVYHFWLHRFNYRMHVFVHTSTYLPRRRRWWKGKHLTMFACNFVHELDCSICAVAGECTLHIAKCISPKLHSTHT